jgi:endonuclease/exonuclease/phosphatase family metal-dependent hydrolase
MPKVLIKRVAIIFLVAVTSFATLGLGTCGADAGKKLNILTINLMLINPYITPENYNTDWPARADTLVAFVQQQEALGQPVDFILCQEGHGGELSKIMGGRGNTIRDLKRRLQKAGLNYYAASAVSFANTEKGLFTGTSNYLVGVLSKYPISGVKRGKLICDAAVDPEPAERKAIACIAKVPAIGRVALFSAHLADACGGSRNQGEQLLAFANRVAKNSPADLYILGGDFNALPDSDLYNYLTSYNLIDTFAEANPGAPGYTFALSGNPYLIPPPPSTPPAPLRIDYIFAIAGKENPANLTEPRFTVLGSRVVLNGTQEYGGFMSDHSGVLSSLIVTPPYGGKPIKGIFAPAGPPP